MSKVNLINYFLSSFPTLLEIAPKIFFSSADSDINLEFSSFLPASISLIILSQKFDSLISLNDILTLFKKSALEDAACDSS